MSARLRLDLIVRTYNETSGERGVATQRDRWTWRLWSGSRIVSTSGSQLYSRRIDCALGSESGAGLRDVQAHLRDGSVAAARWEMDDEGLFVCRVLEVRLVDERGQR